GHKSLLGICLLQFDRLQFENPRGRGYLVTGRQESCCAFRACCCQPYAGGPPSPPVVLTRRCAPGVDDRERGYLRADRGAAPAAGRDSEFLRRTGSTDGAACRGGETDA